MMMQLVRNISQPSISMIALGLCAIITISAYSMGVKYGIAAAIGLIAGFALYHASFGFTSGWRRMIIEHRGNGLRAQFALIMMVSIISYPLIAYGDMLGVPVSAAVAPLSVALLAGAFLFGFGMMFGGGCGSGTLFTAGGGSTRMLIVLAAFIAGSLWGTYDVPWWRSLPKMPSFSVIDQFGGIGAIAGLVIILALLRWMTISMEVRRHGALEQPRQMGSLMGGPWSLSVGVIALAIVCIACFIMLGRPWGITSAFALWGAKIAILGGVDVASWPYWQGRTVWLNRNIFTDTTSVMNFAIMGGAMLASSLAGAYRPIWRLSRIELVTAIIGGLMMGYGARLAYGCNIGAYLGGIVSGSAHGWVWMIAAFAGSTAAIRLQSKLRL